MENNYDQTLNNFNEEVKEFTDIIEKEDLLKEFKSIIKVSYDKMHNDYIKAKEYVGKAYAIDDFYILINQIVFDTNLELETKGYNAEDKCVFLDVTMCSKAYVRRDRHVILSALYAWFKLCKTKEITKQEFNENVEKALNEINSETIQENKKVIRMMELLNNFNSYNELMKIF